MAKVHHVKDGITDRGESITESIDVTPEALQQKFSGYEFRFFERPPRINPEKRANYFASYRHVVLEVEDGESTEAFKDVGYYYLPAVTVMQCRELLK